MKLKDFAASVNELALKHPDLEVVYAKDAEGNGFETIYYPPSLGNFNAKHREFHSEDNIKEEPEYADLEINAVCIN